MGKSICISRQTIKAKIDHKAREKHVVIHVIVRMFMLTLGAMIASIGLEIFLIPNNIIDGGVVGISIMASYLSGAPIGVFLVCLNLPFLYLGYRHIGKTFALSTLYAVLCLAVSVTLLHPIPGLTHDYILAALFGGVILGAGVGLIIRNSGSLDGTEVVAIILDRRTSFSVGEIIMFFNLFILTSAGVVFGWDNAMYSLLTYFVAYRAIDVIIDGLNETKGVFIISDNYLDIADAIRDRLGRELTVFESKSSDDLMKNCVIFVIITRLEVAKLKSIINGFDDNALITITDIEVEGRRFQKRAIH